MTQRLPGAFSDLERFVTFWSLATENDRHSRRIASAMAELQDFYDAIMPRIDEILGYLNDFSLDNLSPEARALLQLTLSLAEIAPAVEQFGQPEVPDGYDSRRVTTQAVYTDGRD